MKNTFQILQKKFSKKNFQKIFKNPHTHTHRSINKIISTSKNILYFSNSDLYKSYLNVKIIL